MEDSSVDSCSMVKEFINKGNPWPESANELYRQSDHLWSAKLVQAFVDTIVRNQRDESLWP
jgi:hypothetical protein